MLKLRTAAALTAALLATAALADPKVVGSDTALGGWNVTLAPAMTDPDSDGVWTATVNLVEGGGVEYKIAPTGSDWTGALGAIGGANMRTRQEPLGAVTFVYDGRTALAGGWLPQPSLSDSAVRATRLDGTAIAAWVVVGDFQSELGDAADFNPGSSLTVMVDDGTRGDRVANDGVLTYRFRAPQQFTGAQFKFAAQGAGFSTKFGADGWSFDGVTADAANATFSAAAGDLVTFEFDTVNGHLRSVVTPPAQKLLVTEVVTTPTEAEFIEIFNPGTVAIDLSDYYLADNERYYQLVQTPPPALLSTDFTVRFPDGAVIGPGEYQTISIGGAECFLNACGVAGSFTGYGVNPTYELPHPTAGKSNAATPDMRLAYPTALGTSRGLTNGNELVVLFHWDGLSDLVTDVDYVLWGTGTTPPVAKTAVSIDGPDADTLSSTYAPDTAVATAHRAVAFGTSGSAGCRADFAQTGQVATGGNGVGGADETSEPSSTTWRLCLPVTPGALSVNLVELTPAAPVLNVGATLTLTASAWGDLGKAQPVANAAVTWSSAPASPTTFSLDAATGVLTGVAAGASETVTATVADRTDTETVTVRYKAVTVTCDETALVNGNTAACTAQALDDADAPVTTTFTWDVQSGTAGTVDPATGVFTAHASEVGAVVVRARGAGDSSTEGTFTLTVVAPQVTQLSIAPAFTCPSPACLVVNAGTEYRVVAGATVSFTASARDQFGDPMTLTGETWGSSDLLVAPAPVLGSVTVGNANGTTQITASANGVTSNAITLVVEQRAAATLAITGAPASSSLNEGATAQLGFTAVDQFGVTFTSPPAATWASSDTAVATVSSTGLVTGVAGGTATVTVTSGSATDSVVLTVVPVPVATTVTVSPASQSVQPDQRVTFTAEVKDQYGQVMTGQSLTWTSSDTAVATVDGAGQATGVAPGTATLTARAGTVEGTATLTVTATPPVLTTLSVSPPTGNIGVGATLQLTAEARDQHGNVMTGVAVTWSSSDTAVAAVDASGLATGVGAGTATLTAQSGSVSGTATLQVNSVAPVVATVEVTPATATAQAGAQAIFTAVAKDAQGATVSGVTFTWTSANTAVATVNASGVATAVAAGTSTITATADGKSGAATLTVTEAPVVVAGVELTPDQLSLTAGDGRKLDARAVDASGNTISGVAITWKSSDEQVATVASDGFVSGLAAGTATITASAGGKSGTATVTVSEKTASGCGCASTGGVDLSFLWTFALGGWFVARRRRQ